MLANRFHEWREGYMATVRTPRWPRHGRRIDEVHPPRPRLRLLRTRAPLLGRDAGTPSRQAPRGLRQGFERSARTARRRARVRRLRRDHGPREEAGIQLVRPRAAHAALEEPVTRRWGQAHR